MKRGPKWFLTRGVLGAALSVAAVATAFFLVTTFLSDGSHEGTTGNVSEENVSLPVTIGFADGLTPTNPVEVTATVNNTSGATRQWQSFVMEIETPTVPQCGAEWLQLYPENSGSESTTWKNIIAGTNSLPLKPVPTGTHSIFDYGSASLEKMYLRFKPSLAESTDQTSCANQPVIVTGHLTE